MKIKDFKKINITMIKEVEKLKESGICDDMDCGICVFSSQNNPNGDYCSVLYADDMADGLKDERLIKSCEEFLKMIECDNFEILKKKDTSLENKYTEQKEENKKLKETIKTQRKEFAEKQSHLKTTLFNTQRGYSHKIRDLEKEIKKYKECLGTNESGYTVLSEKAYKLYNTTNKYENKKSEILKLLDFLKENNMSITQTSEGQILLNSYVKYTDGSSVFYKEIADYTLEEIEEKIGYELIER